MTQYEENLKVLAEKYPQMDVLIEEAKKNLEPELEVIEETSYEGESILKVKKDNHSCYLNGKRNTREPAQIWVETLGELMLNAPVFMMGVGNWTYLQELTDKTENQITVFIYEPSLQIFLKFLENVSLRELMKKHLIIFWVKGLENMDEKAMRMVLARMISYEMMPYSRTFILPNYSELFPEEAVYFLKVMRDIASEKAIQFNTQRRFSAVMVKNLISNARYLCDCYKTTQLIDVIPRDIPGIVVAAGPSLNKNIQELKKAKGKAFIIAVDTAIKPLLDAGVVPDMFAIVDGMKPLSLVAREEAKQIPLMSTLCAASEVLAYHTGMKFFYNEGYQFADVIFARSGRQWGAISTGGSVATSAFSLLHKIGLERIILVGQDLAYTGKKSHADGTFETVMKVEEHRNYIMVEGNVEDEVPTVPDMKHYLDWYNQHIKGIKELNPNFKVINATEGGAKIENTEIMSLKDAIEQECNKEVDIQECLNRLPHMLEGDNREWAKEYIAAIPDEFHKIEEDAKKAKQLYQKLDKICSGKNIDTKSYLSTLKKIKKQIQKLEGNVVYQLVSITMIDAQYILKNEQFMQEDSVKEEGKEIARKGVIYTENVEKMAALFEEYSREVLL